MPSLSKNTFLVQLLAAKTKMKMQDILDILDLLPECMAEAFLQADPEVNEKVFLGVGTLYWKKATKWGPSFIILPTKVFYRTLTRLRMEKEYPLAEKLWNLMHPLSRERALEAIEKRGDDFGNEPNRATKAFKVADRQKIQAAKDKEIKKRNKAKQKIIIQKIKDRMKKNFAARELKKQTPRC